MIDAFKKIIASVLVIAGILPLLLPFAVEIKENIIHLQMERALKKQMGLQQVTVPEKDVVWMDDHEIWVNNKMFDISSKKLEQGVYTFTGLYDEAETLLVMQEKERNANGNNEGRELARIFETLQHLFCEANDNVSATTEKEHSLYPLLTADKPSFPFKRILTPPPQAC